jgi:hypothetical protein
MYVARFSYDVLPVNRQQALEFIRRELQAAEQSRLNARILVPLTRGQGGGAALQFEVELANLDQLDQFRNRGVGSSEDTGTGCRTSARSSLRPHVSKSFGPKSSVNEPYPKISRRTGRSRCLVGCSGSPSLYCRREIRRHH